MLDIPVTQTLCLADKSMEKLSLFMTFLHYKPQVNDIGNIDVIAVSQPVPACAPDFHSVESGAVSAVLILDVELAAFVAYGKMAPGDTAKPIGRHCPL